jgi:hypothetical protein
MPSYKPKFDDSLAVACQQLADRWTAWKLDTGQFTKMRLLLVHILTWDTGTCSRFLVDPYRDHVENSESSVVLGSSY